MSEYANEPIRGLPGLLPAGEEILWQGTPDRRALARTAFRTRAVAGYFMLLTASAIASAMMTDGGYVGVGMTAGLGVLGVALLHVLAWASARTTVYTLTNRRIVLRIGIAVPKCVNLPLGMIGSVDLATRADGTGDVPLVIAGPAKLGILALWPHARPWRIATPQPMLRAIPDARNVAALIAHSCRAVGPGKPRRLGIVADAAGASIYGGRGGMSTPTRAERLPRGTLFLAGALVVFAFAATATMRIAGLPPTASPAALRATNQVALVSSRNLRFVDRADGAVVIEDADRRVTASVIEPGQQTGFVRGVMRGLARERRMHRIGNQPPFNLSLWRDGQLSLTDSATGRSIELTAFGSANRATFMALLPEGSRR